MEDKFVVIDVETANPDLSSICQIGVASFANGRLQDEWATLVDPEDWFDPVNISIHHIDGASVTGAPNLAAVAADVDRYLCGQIVVSHTQFDKAAINQAFTKIHRNPPEATWLDSARIARRAWTQFAYKGYGLRNVSKFLGYTYEAHDALADAKAAGNLVLEACKHTGIGIEEWIVRVSQRIDLGAAASSKIDVEANPEVF